MKQGVSKIRELMPKNYGNILRDRTGKTRVHIYDVVNNERTETEIWPAVLQLAEETLKERKKEQRRFLELKAAA